MKKKMPTNARKKKEEKTKKVKKLTKKQRELRELAHKCQEIAREHNMQPFQREQLFCQ